MCSSQWFGCATRKRRAKSRSLKRGLTTKVSVISTSVDTAVAVMLAPGNAHDAPEGRKLIAEVDGHGKPLVMDRAFEDEKTRKLAKKQGFLPTVPPKKNRKVPWEYDKELYKKRNEIERFFRRIQEYRRVFTRYEKLDVMYLGVIIFALITEVVM